MRSPCRSRDPVHVQAVAAWAPDAHSLCLYVLAVVEAPARWLYPLRDDYPGSRGRTRRLVR